MAKLKKRKWIYINHPTSYDIRCDKCWDGEINKTGTNIDWSEYEHRIWCYDCKEDRIGFIGIFDGPIPMEIAEMAGCSLLRYYFKSKKIMKPVANKQGRIVYRQCKKSEIPQIQKRQEYPE